MANIQSKKINYYLIASFLLVFFVILGYTVKFYPEWLVPFDQPLQEFVRNPLSETKTTFFKSLTFFGNTTTVMTLIALTICYLFIKKYYSELLWVIFTSAFGAILNYLIKFVYQRPRPSIEHLVDASHYSFPSGHSMASLIFYGSLIVLVHLLIKNKSLQTILSAGLFLLILLIGISRVYVGVHYPTDIIGGFLLGGAVLLASIPLFTRIRFIWRFKNKQN